MAKAIAVSEPHGEHVIKMVGDAKKAGDRLYQIIDTEKYNVQFTGEELDWLCQWWENERKRVHK